MANDSDSNQSTPYVSISLSVNESAGIVSAVLSPASEPPEELNHGRIIEHLQLKGVGNWMVYDGAIDDLLIKAKKRQPCQIIIAEKKDALIDLKIAENAMTATLYILPAKGGETITESKLKAILNERKIIEKRIVQSAFQQVVSTNKEMTVVIARGKAPKAGEDSRFVALVEMSEDISTPKENDDGTVDFLAGKEYLSVAEGTPLMERLPPTAGRVGMDIYGQILSAAPGQELPFGDNLEGTRVDEKNPNILIADRGGHPVIFDTGVRVDNILTFENIDMSTGHVEFDGSILVKGDILPEMKVKVRGDLTVKGVIERAQVEVGNDILVSGGLLGDAQETFETEENELDIQYECKVTAGGKLEARYANLAQLRAIGNISIKEYAFNCDIVSEDSVFLGQKGGKGNLVGGKCVAHNEVLARSLGNQAYQKTTIQVGVDQEELRKSQKLLFLRRQRLNQARNLRKIFEELKNRDKSEHLGKVQLNKARKVHEALLKLQQQIQQIDEKLRELDLPSHNSSDPSIGATSRCYPNCMLTINGAYIRIKEEHKAITFVNRGKKITAKN